MGGGKRKKEKGAKEKSKIFKGGWRIGGKFEV